MSRASRCIAIVLFAALLVAVSSSHSAQNKDEAAVKDAWTALQAAIKAKDGDKLWNLIDSATKADAERAAKKVKADYKKADAEIKALLEKELGLAANEFAKMTGATIIKTKRFHARWNEIPGSKVEKITVQGDSAVLNYLEEDGDKEKLNYSRQDGKWKASLPLPKF
jgi:ketosteroid isomerase-like protein